VPHVLAALIKVVLTLRDHLGVCSVPGQMRPCCVNPSAALSLLSWGHMTFEKL
jgi:hypothetical protein